MFHLSATWTLGREVSSECKKCHEGQTKTTGTREAFPTDSPLFSMQRTWPLAGRMPLSGKRFRQCLKGRGHRRTVKSKAHEQTISSPKVNTWGSLGSFMMRTTVRDTACEVLVDSGADVSLISKAKLREIYGGKLPVLSQYGGEPIRAVSGTELDIVGVITLSLRIGEHDFPTQFVVGESTSTPCIVGTDFLTHYECDLSFQTKELTIRKESIEATVPLVRQGGHFVRRVVTSRPIFVEGLTSVLAEGKVVTRKGELANDGIVEPVGSLGRFGLKGELVADNVSNGRARTLLVNENNEPVVIPKGVVIGLLHPLPNCPASTGKKRENVGHVVSNLSCSKTGAPMPAPETEARVRTGIPVREEMMALFDLSHIEDEDDKEKLLDLLVKYEDIVSRSELDVGVTHKLSHTINTGDACPLRQGPRRESPERKEIIRKELAKLLSLGFIEESESPWGAPVVLVNKKDGTKRLCIDYRG
ncbi:uncharacterized protein LOC118419956 [Branchiostoma floridae]|uniref:Uncharacterized protein LOC118419956 n=1 Tax=Branchiostoma floridae TaxID=7739 RepID=A0A9J7LI66_BRAFL|nr:uncharacterized protein LOC118419956 [Branchiostoma floridae]